MHRMVRLLVSTVVQLRDDTGHSAASSLSRSLGASEPGGSHSLHEEGGEALLRLVHTKDRTATARMPAPALGLCFAGVGYEDDGSPAVL